MILFLVFEGPETLSDFVHFDDFCDFVFRWTCSYFCAAY